MFFGLGQVLGPLYGATLYAATDFGTTEDILALFCIAFSVLYFFLADGVGAFRDTFTPTKTASTEHGLSTPSGKAATSDSKNFDTKINDDY